MGWTDNEGNHEGYTAARYPGGLIGGGTWANGGPVARTELPDGTLDYHADSIPVDAATVEGWFAHCDDCGWKGPFHPVSAENPADKYGEPPGALDEVIRLEWRAHLPAPSLYEVRALAAEARAVQDRLAAAVAHARAEGATWADVGDAAGMTRQSAHERWGKQADALAGGFPELRGTGGTR